MICPMFYPAIGWIRDSGTVCTLELTAGAPGTLPGALQE
jgi:hypothetical protein